MSLEERTLNFLKELRDHHGYDDPECFTIHELIEELEDEVIIIKAKRRYYCGTS